MGDILMKIQKYNNEKEELINFLTGNEWPFHVNTVVNRESITKTIESGYYEDEKETYWMIDNGEKQGILIIEDIDDSIPLIDIRLAKTARGKGYGKQALLWLKDYLFGELGKIRVEGYTRADNIAMRKCFTNAGFVKEGYLRNAWENKDGSVSDSVIYAAIRTDWETNSITMPVFDDYPF